MNDEGCGELFNHLRNGEWSWGFGLWANKPMLGIFHEWYDGCRLAIHVGPLWVECDYFGRTA